MSKHLEADPWSLQFIHFGCILTKLMFTTAFWKMVISRKLWNWFHFFFLFQFFKIKNTNIPFVSWKKCRNKCIQLIFIRKTNEICRNFHQNIKSPTMCRKTNILKKMVAIDAGIFVKLPFNDGLPSISHTIQFFFSFFWFLWTYFRICLLWIEI